MSLIPIDGAEIYTETHGDGDAMLLLAGLGGQGGFWNKQLPTLAERYRVVIHDHRGCGRSTATRIVSAAAEMADDVIQLMDALTIDSAHIVGHSTGGAIGQHLALSHPDRVRSLILSASWAGPTPPFLDLFHARRDILINCGVKQYMLVGSLLALPAWWIADNYGSMRESLDHRVQTFAGLEIELARLNAVMTHDLRHRLAGINIPTGVISARDDALTPPAMSAELAELIPDARQVLLPEGGHFCPATVTERYNEELLGLLDQLS